MAYSGVHITLSSCDTYVCGVLCSAVGKLATPGAISVARVDSDGQSACEECGRRLSRCKGKGKLYRHGTGWICHSCHDKLDFRSSHQRESPNSSASLSMNKKRQIAPFHTLQHSQQYKRHKIIRETAADLQCPLPPHSISPLALIHTSKSFRETLRSVPDKGIKVPCEEKMIKCKMELSKKYATETSSFHTGAYISDPIRFISLIIRATASILNQWLNKLDHCLLHTDEWSKERVKELKEFTEDIQNHWQRETKQNPFPKLHMLSHCTSFVKQHSVLSSVSEMQIESCHAHFNDLYDIRHRNCSKNTSDRIRRCLADIILNVIQSHAIA